MNFQLQNDSIKQNNDWLESPEILTLIDEEAKKAKMEYLQGKYDTLEKIQIFLK